MKTNLVIAALLCCIALAGEARAQTVWTYNDLQLNGCTGEDPTKICGIGTMHVDYSTQVYYNLELSTWIIGPDAYDYNVVRLIDNTYIGASVEVPYTPTGEYTTDMRPVVSTNFRSDDGVFYRDYYNLAIYNDYPVLWPSAGGAYGFTGTGQETNLTFSSVVLGLLNRLVIQGVKSGTPDHLRVFHDETVTRPGGCGQLEKRVDYSVVDASGQRVGRVALSEAPQPGLIDSCNNRAPDLSLSCNPDLVNVGGNFRDNLSTGCPTPGGHCGFDFYDVWRWCSTYDGSVCKNLARVYYQVHFDSIKVDNEDDITLRIKKY